MGAYTCWEQQKDRLRAALNECQDTAAVSAQVRRAISQAEQNAMAEMRDDVLRQQAGVLFACCKTSSELLSIPVTATAWVARSQRVRAQRGIAPTLALVAALLQLLLCAYGYFKGLTLNWLAALGALTLAAVAWFARAKARREDNSVLEDDVRVTVHPDVERLFHTLDAQMNAIDRYLTDFAYLNQQNAGGGAPDDKLLSPLCDALEAVYECDEPMREQAQDALERLLAGMGVKALPYTDEQRRFFTVLPSRTETRTLTPALVSADDGRLLRLGMAAVMNAGEAVR